MTADLVAKSKRQDAILDREAAELRSNGASEEEVNAHIAREIYDTARWERDASHLRAV